MPTAATEGPVVDDEQDKGRTGVLAFSSVMATALASSMLGPFAKFVVPLLALRDQKGNAGDNSETEETEVSNTIESAPIKTVSSDTFAVEPTTSIKIDYEQGSNLEVALNILKANGEKTNEYLKSMVDFNTRIENAARQNAVDDAVQSNRSPLPTGGNTLDSGSDNTQSPQGGGGLLNTLLGGLGMGKFFKNMFKKAPKKVIAETAAKTGETVAKTGAEVGEKAATTGAKELVESGAERGAESVGKSVGRELATESLETAGKKGGAHCRCR
jgi:hypothetical protein